MWSWRIERAYWTEELGLCWRRFWWTPVAVYVLASLPGGMLGIWILALAPVALAVVLAMRRIVAGRSFDSLLQRQWQAKVSKGIVGMWPTLAKALRLEIRDARGVTVMAGIGSPSWAWSSCTVPVALPPGLAREDLVAVSDRIAQAFNARRVTVVGQRLDALVMRVEFADILEHPFTFPLGGTWDGSTVQLGFTADSEPWWLPLGPHTLIAGASGSGKASVIWGLLLGLAQPIHSGLIEVWGVDRKGGMELAMGRGLLTRFASDAAHSVALLEDAVEQMQARARDLAGITRQHVASVESPTVIVLVDELAALTSYETDREMLRRANAAIATLASQGRAVGFILIACLQDPRKETLPARGLFTQTIGLRLRDRVETAMVLGDGAVLDGAACHEISSTTPGVAYVLPEAGLPQRVRAAYYSDEQIREAEAAYFAPRQRPVVVAESPGRRPTGRGRTPRPSVSRGEEES